MKYEVTICGVDRATADKLYKMGMELGCEVSIEPDDEEAMPAQGKGKGMMAMAAGEGD